jgi:hypothetical protein
MLRPVADVDFASIFKLWPQKRLIFTLNDIIYYTACVDLLHTEVWLLLSSNKKRKNLIPRQNKYGVRKLKDFSKEFEMENNM